MHSTPISLALLLLFTTLPLRAALPGAEGLAELITKQFDANGDTTIDQTEWQSGLEQSFGEIESGGDGAISGVELDDLAGPIGKEIGEVTGQVVVVLIKKLVLTMDADKDGRVSLKEYTAQATALFTKLDTNKNGSVEQAELLELPKRLLGA